MDINTGRIIKARLAALGKTQKDLFVELNRRGHSSVLFSSCTNILTGIVLHTSHRQF